MSYSFKEKYSKWHQATKKLFRERMVSEGVCVAESFYVMLHRGLGERSKQVDKVNQIVADFDQLNSEILSKTAV